MNVCVHGKLEKQYINTGYFLFDLLLGVGGHCQHPHRGHPVSDKGG